MPLGMGLHLQRQPWHHHGQKEVPTATKESGAILHGRATRSHLAEPLR